MIFILALIFALLFPFPAQAADYQLSISPPVLEMIIQPNKSFIQAITLKNQGNQPLTLTPKIIAVKPIDNQGHLAPTNLQPVTNLPLSFSLENSQYQLNQSLTLPPHQNLQLVLKINSATFNQSQDHYLALALISTPPNSPQPHSQPILTLPLLITLTPDGNFPIDLQLKNFSLPHLHDSATPLKLQPQLQNNSPIMIRPQAKFTIKNWRGQIVHQEDLASNLILGKSSRLLTTKLNQPLIWKPKVYSLGPYQLNLTVISASGKTLISQTQTTFLFPIQSSIYLLTFLILALLLRTSTKNPKLNN